MEPTSAQALPARIKRERSPEPEVPPEVTANKRQAGETSAVARAPVLFRWRTCQELDDVERLKIKEKAVKLADEHCGRIRAVLEHFLSTSKLDHIDVIVMGQQIIEEWLKEYGRIRYKRKSLRILVGVEGPTGAGKSSFLGSLLRIPELFPSGQESAATAVVGKVSWNWVDAPGFEFRAKVIFRKKTDVQEELEGLLRNLTYLAKLLAGNTEDEEDDGTGQADNIAITREAIDHELPKVYAVWGYEEGFLSEAVSGLNLNSTYTQMVDAILNSNSKALSFLTAGTACFNATTAEKLAEEIKPFLDSTTVEHGGEKQFSAWPLVKEVRIYTKANVLKPGITLVDLPGCGDAVGSRSEVTENFAHRLDVRMVVSPIIRAADEKQGQVLMQNGYDEAQMRIAGRLDGNGFCVIMSKMDDMNVEVYISGCPDLRRDPEVLKKQAQIEDLKKESVDIKLILRELKDKKKKAESAKKKAKKAYKRAKKKFKTQLKKNPSTNGDHLSDLKRFRDEQAQAFDQASKELKQCDKRQSKITKEMSYIRDWLHHRAIQTRNKRVKQRIRADFDRRQRNLDDRDNVRQSQTEGEYVLPILPVSTRAFWELEKNELKMLGFPSQVFTGVPAAEQYLHRATLKKREKHLDELLDRYQNLMTMMQIYSAPNGQDGRFDFTRSEVENALANTHATYMKKLSTTLSEASDQIKKLDPLERRQHALKNFLEEAPRIVQKWSYKFPDEVNNVERMHWATYAANISRNGTKFRSHAPPRVTYTWMDHLAEPVMKTICKDWDDKMNKQLPLIKTPMILGYTCVFTAYLNEIQKVIGEKVPSLEFSYNNMRPILENSQHATEIKIRDALTQLAENTATVAFDVSKFLSNEWKPVFRVAMLDSGQGSYKRRKQTIQEKIQNDCPTMGGQMIKRLRRGVEKEIATLPVRLENIVTEEVTNVKQQMSFLVNNLVENCNTNPKKKLMKAKLQDMIRPHVEAWESIWAEEGTYDEHILDVNLSIPDSVPEPNMDDDDSSDNEDSGSGSDSDSSEDDADKGEGGD
ncbi:GTPase SLIP-GC [Fusarium subglutinans]|uniref:GTPase SLIP-GC n=1 Tax=Gibberella subglutinans TaxID=42677 RepID=A0A8H5QAR8_GIBSU|nr:GTPase SLIP-GC [Fusarium subglutinans]KAF5611203.1 GTPase SLIP-GC [Fusarium subglutinans]